MNIFLLCEPRSGSTMLGNWFHNQKIFDVRYETFIHESKWFLGGKVENYKIRKGFKHLVFKEVFHARYGGQIKINWESFFNFADKIIFLHREDTDDQIISWNHAVETGNFCCQYPVNSGIRMVESNVEYFKNLKEDFFNFRTKYKDLGLTISYEDLYYRDRIQVLKDYLNLPDKLDRKFPEGQKYRYKKQKNTKLI